MAPRLDALPEEAYGNISAHLKARDWRAVCHASKGMHESCGTLYGWASLTDGNTWDHKEAALEWLLRQKALVGLSVNRPRLVPLLADALEAGAGWGLFSLHVRVPKLTKQETQPAIASLTCIFGDAATTTALLPE